MTFQAGCMQPDVGPPEPEVLLPSGIHNRPASIIAWETEDETAKAAQRGKGQVPAGPAEKQAGSTRSSASRILVDFPRVQEAAST